MLFKCKFHIVVMYLFIHGIDLKCSVIWQIFSRLFLSNGIKIEYFNVMMLHSVSNV